MPRPERPARPARPTVAILGVTALLGVVLLVMAPHYGPHRDELYFAAAGRHLAWGYPDQPSLTPLLARVSTGLAPHSLVLLRLPSLLAMCAMVPLTTGFARLLGGGRAAQLLTATTMASSALTLTLGHRLTTATFDTLTWTAILLVVAHALVDDRPRLWLVAGLVAGVGLNNKHAVVFVLFGLLVGVLATRETRAQLRTPYPWLGGLLALLLWLPNLLWQARHAWPVLALSAEISEENGGVAGRLGYVGQALVMLSPVIAVLWVFGLVQLLRRRDWVRARPLATAFVVVALFFLVAGGKGYYLGGAIPPLVAAGATALEQRWRTRRLLVAGVVLSLSGMVGWPALVPVLPVHTYTASFYTHLDSDQLETIGWPELVRTVRGTLDGLPAGQRRRAVVFTGNYGEAGALEWYDVGRPVFSGHNGWTSWGPPAEGARPVLVVGRRELLTAFTGCRRAATIGNAEGADNEERGNGVWVCAGPRGSWARQWPALAHLDA